MCLSFKTTCWLWRQSQGKGLIILIKNGICNIYHPNKGLIAHRKMSINLIFILLNGRSNINVLIEECLRVSSYLSYIWHQRYGHISYKKLKTQQIMKMVSGLPKLEMSNVYCENCFFGEQHYILFLIRVNDVLVRYWNSYMQTFTDQWSL